MKTPLPLVSRFLAGMVVLVCGPAAPGAMGKLETDPATLCEIPLLDKEVQLTAKQHEAIKPILKQLSRDLDRWRWRNKETYDKLHAALLEASKRGQTTKACELMNKKKAMEADRQSLVDSYRTKIRKLLTRDQQAEIEGYRLNKEMYTRNKRWRLSAEQVAKLREAAYAQGRMISDFRNQFRLREITRARASLQRYIVQKIFTAEQRAKLEAPVNPYPARRIRKPTEDEKEKARIAVQIWAGKRHLEEVKRSQKITQQMVNLMVEYNIRMAEEMRKNSGKVKRRRGR